LNPCSKGAHNLEAAHAEWKCHKITDEQRITACPALGHVTSAKEVEYNYVEVLVYLKFGSKTSELAILNSGASHHMVNNNSFFKKFKEVNIEINTGNHKQRVVAKQIQIIDNAKNLVTLNDVLFTLDLNQSLISMNNLFDSSAIISKKENSFIINFDEGFKLLGIINNNLFELDNTVAMKSTASSYFSSSKDINWHLRLSHPVIPTPSILRNSFQTQWIKIMKFTRCVKEIRNGLRENLLWPIQLWKPSI
jgi:hypothetical protein